MIYDQQNPYVSPAPTPSLFRVTLMRVITLCAEGAGYVLAQTVHGDRRGSGDFSDRNFFRPTRHGCC